MEKLSQRRKHSWTIDIDISNRLTYLSDLFGITMSEFVNTVLKRYDNEWMWKEFEILYDEKFKKRFGKYPGEVENTELRNKYHEILRDKRTRKILKNI